MNPLLLRTWTAVTVFWSRQIRVCRTFLPRRQMARSHPRRPAWLATARTACWAPVSPTMRIQRATTFSTRSTGCWITFWTLIILLSHLWRAPRYHRSRLCLSEQRQDDGTDKNLYLSDLTWPSLHSSVGFEKRFAKVCGKQNCCGNHMRPRGISQANLIYQHTTLKVLISGCLKKFSLDQKRRLSSRFQLDFCCTTGLLFPLLYIFSLFMLVWVRRRISRVGCFLLVTPFPVSLFLSIP